MKRVGWSVALAVLWMVSGAHGASPYADEAASGARGLPAAEVEGLLAGSGMGMARPAELNHYPGPRHVLELTTELALTASQIEQTEALFGRMQASAKDLGARIVEEEQALDTLFATGTPDVLALESRLGSIGQLRAQLRLTHLSAHLEQRPILTPHQVDLYDRLRGYGDSGPADHDPAHGHGNGHQ